MPKTAKKTPSSNKHSKSRRALEIEAEEDFDPYKEPTKPTNNADDHSIPDEEEPEQDAPEGEEDEEEDETAEITFPKAEHKPYTKPGRKPSVGGVKKEVMFHRYQVPRNQRGFRRKDLWQGVGCQWKLSHLEWLVKHEAEIRTCSWEILAKLMQDEAIRIKDERWCRGPGSVQYIVIEKGGYDGLVREIKRIHEFGPAAAELGEKGDDEIIKFTNIEQFHITKHLLPFLFSGDYAGIAAALAIKSKENKYSYLARSDQEVQALVTRGMKEGGWLRVWLDAEEGKVLKGKAKEEGLRKLEEGLERMEDSDEEDGEGEGEGEAEAEGEGKEGEGEQTAEEEGGEGGAEEAVEQAD